jgi:hypothetical protein
VKVAAICDTTHNPYDETHWVSCLRENLTSSSYGEGLETDRAMTQVPRQSFTRQQVPLAAKQMLGAHRAFVFGAESRYRLPELVLLAGNVLTYVAATTAAMATGFWDRRCRPTCGRLRRVFQRVDFAEIPLPAGPLRKKASVTAHLLKGVQGHRRRPDVLTLPANSLRWRKAA